MDSNSTSFLPGPKRALLREWSQGAVKTAEGRGKSARGSLTIFGLIPASCYYCYEDQISDEWFRLLMHMRSLLHHLLPLHLLQEHSLSTACNRGWHDAFPAGFFWVSKLMALEYTVLTRLLAHHAAGRKTWLQRAAAWFSKPLRIDMLLGPGLFRKNPNSCNQKFQTQMLLCGQASRSFFCVQSFLAYYVSSRWYSSHL